MNYQVLARRYRPRTFEEVVGQESVAATLRGGIQQGRVAHAYLFTGPRGTGKTSMARIFAKALNCPRASDPNAGRSQWGSPCNACSACEAIHLGQDIDVVELDGASHRGIEDMRSIIEGVNRPATKSLFKIFIIDEAHMLTREAFNALLKTLEEPPPHVKFIFATTEPQRIPETVLSRCQRFDFASIGNEAIVKRLAQILESEGRTAEAGLLEKVALHGKGGLRDAQTLLDQLMTFCEGLLTLEALDQVTGRVSEASMDSIASFALGGKSADVLRELKLCFGKGADPSILLEQVVDAFRARIREALEAPSPSPSPSLSPSAGALIDRLIGSLEILLEAAARLRYSPFPQASVEVVLLKLSRLEDPAALEEVLRALSEMEKRGARSGAQAASGSISASAEQPLYQPPQRSATPAAAAPPAAPAASPAGAQGPPKSPAQAPDFRQLVQVWTQIQIELEEKHPDIAPFLQGLKPQSIPGAGDTFLLEFQNAFYSRQLKSQRKQDVLLDVVAEVTGARWKLRMTEGRDAASPSEAPAQEGPPAADQQNGAPLPPAGPRARGGEILNSPIVKKSLDLFNGRIV